MKKTFIIRLMTVALTFIISMTGIGGATVFAGGMNAVSAASYIIECPSSGYDGYISTTSADDVIVFHMELTEPMARLVVSFTKIPRNAYTLDIYRDGVLWRTYNTVEHQTYSDCAEYYNNALAGDYLFILTVRGIYKSSNMFRFKINFTNNTVTNYGPNDDYFQHLTTIQSYTVTGSGTTYTAKFTLIQEGQSVLTGETYYVKFVDRIKYTGTKAQCDAYVQSMITTTSPNGYGYRIFGTNPVIRYTFTY